MPAPSAENAPRLHGGRKGAYGVAPRWRKRHPCPHRSDEQCGQDEGDRGRAGPSARLPSHGTGAERLSRAPSVSLLFALVTGRFALGRMDPAQGPACSRGSNELSRRTGPDSLLLRPFLLSARYAPDAVTHVQDVLARVVDIAGAHLPDEFELDVLGSEVVEQAAAAAQQHRDHVQVQLVDLARS
jgi:hypothetical protein